MMRVNLDPDEAEGGGLRSRAPREVGRGASGVLSTVLPDCFQKQETLLFQFSQPDHNLPPSVGPLTPFTVSSGKLPQL